MHTQAESTYIAHNMFGQIKMEIPWYINRHTLISRKRGLQGGYKGVTRMAYSPSLWLMATWLVKQNQPVSNIETKSDTNLRSLYES